MLFSSYLEVYILKIRVLLLLEPFLYHKNYFFYPQDLSKKQNDTKKYFKMRYAKALMGSLFLASAQAHMIMIYPPAFGGPNNPNTKKDDDLTRPLTIDQFPCKGYQTAMKDPTGAGTPTASWAQGGSYNFSLSGGGGVDSDGAPHGGGSCQVALSYDQGTSFTVIHSYMGGCGFKGSYKFTVPSDAPVSKTAMFAW